MEAGWEMAMSAAVARSHIIRIYARLANASQRIWSVRERLRPVKEHRSRMT